MRRLLTGLLLALAITPAAAEDIVVRGMGSFHVGGRIAEVSGKEVRMIQRQPGGPMTKLDPNGQYMVEHMYVQYFLPKNRKGKYLLLLAHGGGLIGVTFESAPDGRDGWLNYFVRMGWDVYNTDSVERGRSGFAGPDVWPDVPIFLTLGDPFERWRVGQGEGSWDIDPAKRKVPNGSQYPVEAYENFMRQAVPRWLSTDKWLSGAGEQDLPMRDAVAQWWRAFRLSGGGTASGQDQGHRCDRGGHAGQDRQRGEAEGCAGAADVRRLR